MAATSRQAPLLSLMRSTSELPVTFLQNSALYRPGGARPCWSGMNLAVAFVGVVVFKLAVHLYWRGAQNVLFFFFIILFFFQSVGKQEHRFTWNHILADKALGDKQQNHWQTEEDKPIHRWIITTETNKDERVQKRALIPSSAQIITFSFCLFELKFLSVEF